MRKKIAIFQTDLSIGGIQKSLIDFLNVIEYAKVEVDLFLFSKRNDINANIPPEVTVRYIKPLPKITKVLPFGVSKRLGLRHAISDDYDYAVDYNSYSYDCSIATLNSNAKRKIMWIHNDLKLKIKYEWKYRINFHLSKAKFYLFDDYVSVSEGAALSFAHVLGITKSIKVIQNRINAAEIMRKSDLNASFSTNKNNLNVLSVGRLSVQKGFDLLLREFAQALAHRENMDLYIIGDGPERKKLQHLAAKLHIEKKVHFLGAVANPYPFFKMMDIFVMASRYEGQGIVLREAQCIGLPVIMSKNLEMYNPDISGVESIAMNLVSFVKSEKKPYDFSGYDEKVKRMINEIFEN